MLRTIANEIIQEFKFQFCFFASFFRRFFWTILWAQFCVFLQQNGIFFFILFVCEMKSESETERVERMLCCLYIPFFWQDNNRIYYILLCTKMNFRFVSSIFEACRHLAVCMYIPDNELKRNESKWIDDESKR